MDLRLSDEELEQARLKGEDRVTTLGTVSNGSKKARLEQLEAENRKLREELDSSRAYEEESMELVEDTRTVLSLP